MTISIGAIEAIAPDQASLKAAGGLLSPSKWTERQRSEDGQLIWGACQGSGANPYRVTVDLSDLGAKCTCPSRKFPCKHGLALMLLYLHAPADFAAAPVPDWVAEWMGRQRRGAAPATAPQAASDKDLAAALAPQPPAEPPDPKDAARREADRLRRAEATKAAVTAGLAELEGWIADQLRTGLGGLLADLTGRCRRIAARLVDARAQVLAARLDTLPGRIAALPDRARSEALIAELGRLVILSRAFRGGACPPEVWREIVTAETRESLLADPAALRVIGPCEVLAMREETRRDGLIARETWLLGLAADMPRFALLLDFFPAATGRQGSPFDAGAQFQAELVFYPAPRPLRAQIVTRSPLPAALPWPEAAADPLAADPLADWRAALQAQPWLLEYPLLLPPGGLATDGPALWWQGAEAALPLRADRVERVLQGTDLRGAAVLWDGQRGDLLAADTALGHYPGAP